MVQPPPLKPTSEVKALLDQAQRAVQSRNAPSATALYDQALHKARELKDRKGEADSLRGQGSLYAAISQPQKALETYQQALSIYQALEDKKSAAITLNSLGNVSLNIGEFSRAREFFQQALPVAQALGDKQGEASVLGNLGIVSSRMGESLKALEFYQQVLAIRRGLGDKRGEAGTLNSIGLVYKRTGQYPKALEFYQQALPLFQELGDKLGEAGSHNNIGNIYSQLGQLQKALEVYQRLLPIFQALGDKQSEVGSLNNIGAAYKALKQPDKALTFFLQVLSIVKETGDRQGEAIALDSMGVVYQEIGQPQKAWSFYSQSLLIYRSQGVKSEQADTLMKLARVEEQLKRPADAEVHYAEAVTLLEALRDNLGGLSEAKSAFLGSTLKTYYAYLGLLLERGKPETAFEIAQKTKARSLLDLMASGRVEIGGGLSPDERQQEQALRQRADLLNEQMVNEGIQNEVGAKNRFAALKDELTKTESQLQMFTDTLYARHPGLAQKRIAKTITLTEIAKLLPADTALLDYIVVEEDKLALFVATRSGVKALILPLNYAKLVTKTTTFRSACADPRKDYKKLALELHAQLLAPAAKYLRGLKRLVICPDGALWDVPFQALLSEGQFLAQRFEISYAYSATGAQAVMTVKTGRAKPTQTLLALANPDFGSSKRFGDLNSLVGQRPIDTPSRPIDTPSRPIDTPSRAFDTVSRGGKIAALPGTQREADALKKLFPSATLMTGKAAQEAKAKVEATKFRYLHFATHGFFNDASPMLSSLVLAQPSSGSKEDGFLTAREIFDLDLSAEMVVLSACNTARGVQRTGDGVIGLTWALFVAGCPTQVVSQWAVDDASTATLMTSFYGNLATKKLGKGAALRQASLSLMSSPKHAHPYYWAPFVLMGDWR